MVLLESVNTQYAFPVGLVVICVILVFVFGFKSAEQPAFDQLTTYTGDDRKPAGKKRKLKDKKSQSNGHATAVGSKQTEVKSSSVKAAKSEKSPLKEVSNKVVNKQPKKPESSPIKDKSLAKQKDNKKESESPPKQLKDKKQVAENTPAKNNKNVAAIPKGKGKENQVEEIKNKKNEKNLAKVKKLEVKPAGDGGGWKQVLSNKDKKNRKKDEPEFDDIVPEKNGTSKAEGTPKKKKTKNIELVIADTPATKENKDIEEGKEIIIEVEPKKAEKGKKANKAVEDKINELEKNGEEIEKKIEKSEKKEKPEKKKADKQSEKKKKVEQESKGEKEVDEKVGVEEKMKVVEEVLVVDIKPLVELSPDAAAVEKKKNKKKADSKKEADNKKETDSKKEVDTKKEADNKKEADHKNEVDSKKEAAVEIVEEAVAPKKLSESSENVDSNKKATPVETDSADVVESKAEPATTVVFDELGDTWKEAKVPKKNKKKVRKDQ